LHGLIAEGVVLSKASQKLRTNDEEPAAGDRGTDRVEVGHVEEAEYEVV
jgi:hypothetical protein